VYLCAINLTVLVLCVPELFQRACNVLCPHKLFDLMVRDVKYEYKVDTFDGDI
jgi:hypothetical protein